jgi:hypothetical protein
MLRDRYERERGKILGRSSGIDPGHFSPLADRFQRLIDSVSTIAGDLFRPQSGVEYAAAVARAGLGEPGVVPGLACPAPGVRSFSTTGA